MPVNAFDDALTRLPAAPNPYDAIADDMLAQRTSAVKTAVDRGAKENPDQQAELIRTADRLRIPLDVVKRNPDIYKGAGTQNPPDLDRLAQDSPRLARYLTASPEFASVAHDDLPQLSAMERAVGVTTDVGISLLKGAIGIPQAAVGLASLATGGHAGKFLEDTVGFRPDAANQILSSYYSEPQRAAFLRVQQANGLVGKATAALSNPSVIGQSVLQSLPLMLGGAGVARGLIGLAPSVVGGVTAGAIGEGAVGAGLAAEQTRTENADRLLTGKQAALSVASGAGTAALSLLGGRIAKTLGVADVDTLLAGAVANPVAARGLTRSVIYGAVSEGVLEELPQSVQEQVLQNAALDRPLDEGVAENAVLGALAGAIMGGGANLTEHYAATRAQATAKTLTDLGAAASQSKTAKRSPAAVESFMGHVAQGKAVYAPIETWTTYWQSKGEDPAQRATDLTGDASAYQRAVDLGTDLEIPLAKYAAKLAPTEHNAFFATELKLDPAEMNARETEAYVAQLQQQREGAAPETVDPQALEQATQLMVERMVAVGIPQETAQTYGTLWSAAIGTLAQKVGIDPRTLQARYGPGGGPTITREGMEPAAPSTPIPAEAPPEQAPEGVPAEVPTPEPETPDTILAPDLAAVPDEDLEVMLREAPDFLRLRTLTDELTRRLGVVTKERRAIERNAETDPLTGLGNRRALEKALPAAEADPNTAVLFFDANNFGQINKAAGHAAGDATLKEVAVALQQAASEVGMGARVFRRAEGGDEFVALVPRAVAADVRQRAEALFGARQFTDKAGQPFEVSLTGTEGGTIAEAEAQLQAAKDARKRAPQWAPSTLSVVDSPATIADTEVLDGTLPPAAGDSTRQGLDARRDDGERTSLEAGGLLVPGGATDRGEPGGLPAARLRGLPDVDETFTRDSADVTRARFTPDITRELARIADELDTFPFEENVWVWDHPEARYDPNFGTAAGGKATIVPGNAGAPVYDDILAFSPVNTFKGKAAKKVRGSRGDVLQAVRAALANQDIASNLAEGAVRVAEHRAANDYYYLSQPLLPHRGGDVLTNEQAATDLTELDAIEPEGDVDTSFDPTKFNQEMRGEITFTPNRQFNIHLLEHADLSTFLHETGHFFLEVLSDLANQAARIDPESRTAGQQQLLADVETLDAWLVDEGKQGDGWSVQQHEQFARGFEAYLMEGTAPSVALRSAFARARAWLLGIYRSLRNLHVTLTPEVRGVFDRLLATDAAIAEAQQQAHVSPLFTTAESAGMSDDEFGRYRATVEDASRKAKEELDRRLLAEVQREQTATWKAQREAIRQQVEAEVQQQPVYRALAAMQKGTHANGEPLVEGEPPQPLKLSKTIISERYGAERLKALPKPYIYSREGGLDPDAVAEMFGFSSGDALLSACSTAPSMRSVIERETAARMFQQHGSLLLDGTIIEKARAAVANDARATVVTMELTALVKAMRARTRGAAATIRAAIPSQVVIRQAARAQVARTRLADLRPQVYWAAGNKAGRQATEFAARQQLPEAIEAKRRQLFNLALYREALRAKEAAETNERWVRTQDQAAGRQRLAEAGGSYLDQWDGWLDRYEFKRVPQNVLDRRARLQNWIASQKAEGLGIDLPEALLDEARRINYRQLTVEEFTGVVDGLKQLVHFATFKRKLLGRQAQRELDDVAGTVAERLYTTATGTTAAPRLTRNKSTLEKVQKHGRDMLSAFLNADTILRDLDGWTDLGPVYENLKGGIDRAVVEELIPRTNATAEKIEALNSVYTRGELQKPIEIQALNDSLTHEEIIAFALNWGTADNRAALLESKKWAAIGATEQTAQAILDKLDERDVKYVQSVWDYIETFWPEIEASQKRRKGIAPTKVEALPFQTKHGTSRGGYYPLKYDSEGSILVRQDEIEDAIERMRTGRYAAAATKHGFAKERVGSGGRPVLLSLSVIAQHVGEVNYDLALGDEIRSADRILRHRGVREAFETTGRQNYYEALDLWLHDVATGEILAADVFSKASRRLRSGLTVSALGFNMGTAAMNAMAPVQSAVVIGKRAMLRGMTDLVTHKWFGEGNVFQQVIEASPFMGERQTTFNKDIMTAMETVKDSRIPAVIPKSMYYFITKSQWLADVATWLGAHRKGLTQFDGDSDKAVAYADRMVARSQASGLWADRTAIERGTLSQSTRQSEFVKMWTTLMSYMLAKGNVAYETTRSTNFRKPSQVLGWTVDMALLFAVEALFAGLLRGQFDDDDEWDAMLATWLSETGKNMLGVVPFAREVGSAIEGYPTGGPLGSAVKRIAAAYTQIEQGEFDAAMVKAVNTLGGMLLKYPSSAINRVITAGTKEAEGEDVPLLDYLIYREDRGESRR